MTLESVLARSQQWRASRTHTFRQLWQVPTFFVGLLALVIVGSAHPLWSHGGTRHLARSLAEARAELEGPRSNPERVLHLASDALRQATPGSAQAGEAHFLIGSAHLRRAELAPADSAGDLWQKARDHLDQADHLGVADSDRSKLAYRLGKVHHALNGDPQRVIDCMMWSIHEAADDPFEAYGLLAQAYLRLPAPDLRGALEATRKQLALPNANENSLAAPRLLCGELLRKLDQPDEARKVLARIGPSADPDVLFRARYLRARLYQEEGAWAEAAAMWEGVKSDPRWVTVEPARVLYSLGLCYRKLDRIPEAIGTWEATKLRGSEEGQAASLGLAELRLRGDKPSAVLEAFETALRGVTAPADYHNSLVDLAEVRTLLESACQHFKQTSAFEQAVQLANLYEKVAPPGVAQQLAAEATEAWAKSLRAAAQTQLNEDSAKRSEDEARQRYRQAGIAFEAAASLATNPNEQAEWLWRAIGDYLEGRDHARAVHVLDRYVQLPIPLERQGRAWHALGEAHRVLRNQSAAQSAYQKCIEYPGPFAYRARYELAITKIEQKNLDDAEEDLKQNLRLMQTAPDAEAYERTLVTLASLLYQRKNYPRAFDRLQEALERYPANPNAVKLRLQLAQCCRQLAEEANDRLTLGRVSTAEEQSHYRAQRQKYLETAAGHYQKLVEDIESLQVKQTLSREQEAILGQSRFAVADCRFDLGQYNQALVLYNVLAKRYQNQVEGLVALKHAWQCHCVMFQPDLARGTLDRIRSALPSTTFDAAAENRTRAWWDNWLVDVSKLREAPRPPSR
ncbi:MAG: tetratricopeptide repeat protein [Gemmataceae bacterium]|nr:tetratricopeptide repeat protein [Gemmataceae bacterium]